MMNIDNAVLISERVLDWIKDSYVIDAVAILIWYV